MKTQLLTGLAMASLMTVGQGAIYYQGTGVTGDTAVGTLSQTTIIDGSPANVIANSMNLSPYASGNNWSLTSLTITLNISGGLNNGLYGYLVAPNGSTVTLMNQPGYAVDGFGATSSGMNVTLSDGGGSGIQGVTGGSGVLMGTYQAAGSFSTLNGLDPNGLWTLYFSDTLGGGGNATLNGWSLDISAVPEPTNVALGVFGVLAAGCLAWKQWRIHQQGPEAD